MWIPSEIQKARISAPLISQCSALLLLGRAAGLGFVVHPKVVGRRDVRGLGIQQALVVGTQAQFDQCPRIGRELGLPAVVGLVFGHGVLAGLVPNSGRLAREVMLANQRGLDRAGAFFIDPALPVRMRCTLYAGLGAVLGSGRGVSLGGL